MISGQNGLKQMRKWNLGKTGKTSTNKTKYNPITEIHIGTDGRFGDLTQLEIENMNNNMIKNNS